MVCKMLAAFSIIWCLFLLLNETALVFKNKISLIYFIETHFADDVWVTFLMTVFITSGMVATSFFTIFKLKFSDYV